VVAVTDQNFAVAGLLLEMAFQAKVCTALREQFLIHGAVRRMARDTTLPNRFVFENERPALRGMTLQTGSVRAQHREPAALHGLGHVGSSTPDCVALVRVMAIRAAHLAFHYRMVVRQFEGSADIGVTLEAGRWRLPRIHDLAPVAAALDVQTSGAVARFAPHAFGVVTLRFQPGMGRGPKIAHDHIVTRGAFL
jgi:hypothetical protein